MYVMFKLKWQRENNVQTRSVSLLYTAKLAIE